MKFPTETTPSTRAIGIGVLGWLLFAIVAVALRGVRWEETYEHALVINGVVPYPEGHPAFRYSRNIFSGQCYFTALLLLFSDNAVLLNGFRNVLQLAFTTIPVFLLGTRLGKGVRVGHLSVILILLAVHQNFQSYYPIEPWPYAYGNGQIGVGFALLIFAALLYERWRTAWFMLGLLVMVHLGQLPVIGAFAGIQWIIYLVQRNGKRVAEAIVYFALGLVPCVIFYLVHRQFHVPLPDTGAYAVTGDTHALWRTYTESLDIHRGTPRFNPFWKSWIAIGLLLLLAVGLWATGIRQDRTRRDFGWIAVYGLVISVCVGGIWLLHQALGSATPFLLIGWMPYRLSNHLAILLVPVCVAEIHFAACGKPHAERGVSWGISGVLLYAALYPFWAWVVPPSLYSRYVANPELLLFMLCGMALYLLAGALPPTRRWSLIAIAIVGGLLLAGSYPFALAGLIGGGLAIAATIWCAGRLQTWPALETRVPWLLIAVGVVLLAQQARHREHLPVHPLQLEVMNYLADQDPVERMILTPYWDIAWTPKTHLATFSDYMVPTYISYMPELGPAINAMYRDVYGAGIGEATTPPLAAWPERTAARWQELGAAYGFRYVLAPAEMRLQLEPVLVSSPYTMYRLSP